MIGWALPWAWGHYPQEAAIMSDSQKQFSGKHFFQMREVLGVPVISFCIRLDKPNPRSGETLVFGSEIEVYRYTPPLFQDGDMILGGCTTPYAPCRVCDYLHLPIQNHPVNCR